MTDEHLYTYGVIGQADIEFDLESDGDGSHDDETENATEDRDSADSTDSATGSGVNGAKRLYTVDYRTLSAVVSDIATLEPEESDENLRAHDEALQTIMEHEDVDAVVPMRFGMVFKSARPLKNVLRGSRSVLTRTLNDVEGTVEMGIKLVAEEDATLDREAIREDVSDRLADACLEETENDLFSDRLVLNRSYLVSHDGREAFDRAVAEIEAEYSDRVLVQYTGPWAPYNFVDLEIGVDR